MTATAAAVVSSAFSRTASPATDAKPNILFILADDMGLMDTPLFGSEARVHSSGRPPEHGMAPGVACEETFN